MLADGWLLTLGRWITLLPSFGNPSPSDSMVSNSIHCCWIEHGMMKDGGLDCCLMPLSLVGIMAAMVGFGYRPDGAAVGGPDRTVLSVIGGPLDLDPVELA
ncbi:hypothetical protein ACLOJK_027499 [Asimina triloba]